MVRTSRVVRAFAQGAVVAIGLGVFLLLALLPFALSAHGLYVVIAWVLGAWANAPAGRMAAELVSVAGSIVLTLLVYRGLFRAGVRIRR